MLALGFVLLAHVGAPAHSFTHSPGAHGLLRRARRCIALLFLCGSLPIFLGSGGGRRGADGAHRTWSPAWSSSPRISSSRSSRWPRSRPVACAHGDLPGYAIASAYSGRWFAIVDRRSGPPSASAGLIVAEYLALSRLLFSVTGIHVAQPPRAGSPCRSSRSTLLSLTEPGRFDENVLRPSLIALFLSQMIVFAVFPTYRRRRGRLTAVDVAARRRRVRAHGLGPLPRHRRARQHVSAAYDDSRMNPWRAALTSATASGNSTRIASRIAIDCSSAPPCDLDLRERRRGQLDGGVQGQRRELLALRLLHRLRLLLGELAQPAQEILGVAAERESEATPSMRPR